MDLRAGRHKHTGGGCGQEGPPQCLHLDILHNSITHAFHECLPLIILL